MRHLALAFALLSTTCLPGQTAPVQDRPQVLLDTVGPDGWRTRLGPTNLGSMLESELGQPLWRTRIQPLMGMWQQLIGGDKEFEASRERLLGYSGRIRVGLWYDDDAGRQEPAACIAAVLEPDRRSDLKAIAGDLRQTLYEAIPGEWAKVNGEDFAGTVRRSGELTVIAPRLEDGSLLIAASRNDDLARALARARALAATSTGPLKPNSPAGRLEIDFQALGQTVMAAASKSSRAAIAACGGPSLGTATLSISTAGPRVQFEYKQEFTSDDRGLFAALMPATPTTPTLFATRPESGSWVAGHFDLLKFHDVMIDITVADGDQTKKEIRASIKDDLGIHLDTDLFAHMTDEAMLWLPSDKEPLSLFSQHMVYIARLRDEDAFRKSLLTMIPNLDPFLRHNGEEEFEGVTIHSSSYSSLAAGHGVFVFAYGEHAEQHVRTTLDRCKNLPKKPGEPILPTGFDRLQRHLPPGFHGASELDALLALSIPDLVLGILAFVPAVPVLNDLPFDVVFLPTGERAKLTRLLKDHQLETARAATGYADRTWRWRTYW